MKVINMFGAAGSGKSTNAAGLAYELKKDGFKVELVTEFAKELCITKSEHLLENQIWVFANQYHKMKYLSKDLDFIITDSPLILSSYYGYKYNFEFKTLYLLVEEVFNSFDNINIFLERAHEWDPYARVQTEEESKKDSEDIKKLLDTSGIKYEIFQTGRYLPAILKKYILDNNYDIVEKHHNKNSIKGLKAANIIIDESSFLDSNEFESIHNNYAPHKKAFLEDFEKIQNKFIGLPNDTVNYQQYLSEVNFLETYYRKMTGDVFIAPPSKLDWKT